MHHHITYADEKHPVAAIDVRIKILAFIAVIVMIISYKGFVFPVVVSAAGIALCAWMKMPMRTLLLRMSEPVVIVLILVLLKTISISHSPDDGMLTGSTAIYASAKKMLAGVFGSSIVFSRDGFLDGLQIGARIIGASIMVGAMSYATPFEDFVNGLSWLRVPKSFVDILMFAYRYLFTLFEEAQVIYLAQKNRLGYSSMVGGFRSLGTLAGALTIRAFDQSQNISVAMVQRGYDGTLPQHLFRPLNGVEITLLITVVTSLGVLWKTL